MIAAPKAHPQSSGSVGQLQRTLYGQLSKWLHQASQNTSKTIDCGSALCPWAVKHAQWLLNRYLIHSDGKTSYFRGWNRSYDGGLCCFGEVVQAKFSLAKTARKSDQRWETALWLGRDSEADETFRICCATCEVIVTRPGFTCCEKFSKVSADCINCWLDCPSCRGWFC